VYVHIALGNTCTFHLINIRAFAALAVNQCRFCIFFIETMSHDQDNLEHNAQPWIPVMYDSYWEYQMFCLCYTHAEEAYYLGLAVT
jgi:hypothetical protein